LISSIVFFVPVTLGVVLLSLSIRRAVQWRELAGLTTTLAVGVALPFVLLPVAATSDVAGLVQRVAFAFLFGWMVVVGYRMLKGRNIPVVGPQA
jgi:Na+/proline symporter